MRERLLCLDTSVLIKYLTPDEQEEAATNLIADALQTSARLVAPAWAWAEVGSVLLKKVRMRLLEPDEAHELWTAFRNLPIDYVEVPELQARAWEIATRYGLPTLYDAAFLACTETAPAPHGAFREFWTADAILLRHLGDEKPSYVQFLSERHHH